MNTRLSSRTSRRVVNGLAIGICLSVGGLTWLGYRAMQEWQRSSSLLADQQTSEAAESLATMLARDMQGVQHSVLLATDWQEFNPEASYRVLDLVASAFARYPYPESFFAWRVDAGSAGPVFFSRRDRLPLWLTTDIKATYFPVVVGNEAPEPERLLGQFRIDAKRGERFSVFSITIRGTPYQVVARLIYRDPLRQQLGEIVGFTVNVPWVREHYFRELTEQFMKVGGASQGLVVAVVDHEHAVVAGTAGGQAGWSTSRRSFAPLFFDPLLVAPDIPRRLGEVAWAVESRIAGDSPLTAAVATSNRMMFLGAFAAGALTLGLMLTLRAVRTNTELAELRSDFVSTVTHELKAPIGTIRAAGETLATDRLQGHAARREYAQLIVVETRRLARLVDNLLAFSRVTDAAAVYSFEPLAMEALVTEALERHSLQLEAALFELGFDVPSSLPLVRADRTAIALLLDNLIDNAVRHAAEGRHLDISARLTEGSIQLEVRDRGAGIAVDEIRHVTKRFFRGRNARAGGTGLGLAIVHRIAVDHGGSLTLASTIGTGTSVTVTLPAA